MFDFLYIPRRLTEILALLSTINNRLRIMNEQLEELAARVSEIETVGDSAITLLTGLKAALDEAIASGDMSAVQSLSDRLSAQTEELASAISANTPDAPEPDEV